MDPAARLIHDSVPGAAHCRPRAVPVLLILISLVLVAPVAAGNFTGCTNCGQEWQDTCAIFEQNNETAYIEDMEGAFAPIAANLTPAADFSTLSWSQAFLSLHAMMKERYAFTAWRNIDWDALNTTWGPAVAAAEKKQDAAAYYRAIRGYLYSIPDGHVNVLATAGDSGAKYADIGGGYGMTLVQLDSGDVVVAYVANGSAAEKAGVRAGDEVTGWNGREIHDAVNSTSIIWAYKKPSTREAIQIQKTRLVTRAPVGRPASVKITYGNIPHPRVLNLTAYDDGYETLAKGTFFIGKSINDIGADDQLHGIRPQVSNDTITVRTLPGGYTYIAVYEESFEIYQPFRQAMLSAIANQSRGIVLDLRYNNGGDDNLAACMAGWFVDKPVFYEYLTRYDPGTGQFPVLTKAWAQPQPSRFDGPVAVMVSPDTISSGEGVPNIVSRTGRGAIVSFYGSNGAFGLNNFQAALPGGLYVLFPDGASLDQNGTVQVDSSNRLSGGIAPTVRVPVTNDTLTRAMNGEDVQLAYAMEWLDSQQPGKSTAAPVTTKKSPFGIALAVLAIALLVLMAGRK